MLALRTDAGVDGAQLAARYPRNQLGAAAAAACADAAAELPDEWVSYEAQTLRLKNPEGLLFSNDAISTVFARLEERLEDAEQATGTAGAR